jgi:hypothetical protein
MCEVAQVIASAFGSGFDSAGTLGFPRVTYREIGVQVTARKGVLLRLHHGPERNSWCLESQLGACADMVNRHIGALLAS